MEEKKLIRFDWAAKNILRDKSNFDILEGFLTAILQKDIKIINLLESESNQSEERASFIYQFTLFGFRVSGFRFRVSVFRFQPLRY